MTGAPLVSCIIPAYNAAPFIAEAIDSILGQKVGPLEILVVDDGSTDGTKDIVAGFKTQVGYRRQLQQGPVAARNFAIHETTGEFVAFLDADDVWHPERLSRALARFNVDPSLEVTICHAQNFRSAGEFCDEAVPAYVAGGILARRSVFGSVGFFIANLQHAAELEWFIRARELKVGMELLPDVLYYRRLHDTNFSTQNTERSLHEHIAVLRSNISRKRTAERATD